MLQQTFLDPTTRIRNDLEAQDLQALLDSLEGLLKRVKGEGAHVATCLKNNAEVDALTLHRSKRAVGAFNATLGELERMLLSIVDRSPNSVTADRIRDAVQNFWNVSGQFERQVMIPNPNMRVLKDTLKEFCDCWADLQLQYGLLT